MSLILNIETSTNVCSVVLAKDQTIIDSRENTGGNDHSSLLTVFIEEILIAQNLYISDLDAIAVSKGPGSYTGLRIGVSTAKGLCYGSEKPLISVSTLQMMAKGILNYKELQNILSDKINTAWFCPMIDARRMEVYAGFYDIENKIQREISADIITETSYIDILEKRPVVFFGNGAEKCKIHLNHPNAFFIDGIYPSAKDMISISASDFHDNKFEDIAYFEPFYLKDFVATTPKKKI